MIDQCSENASKRAAPSFCGCRWMSITAVLLCAVSNIQLSAQQDSRGDDGGKRARDWNIPFSGTAGPLNAITDVSGVQVGHSTVISGTGPRAARTGVTAVLANSQVRRVFAATHTYNGNGEMTGMAYIDDYGFLISPVMLTNTVSVGTVRDETIKWSLATDRRTVNLPVVAETWDGFLNDIYGFHVGAKHVEQALAEANGGPVEEGNVGGGTGMVCHLFKGGIGTSSRVIESSEGLLTLGVLVQANYGLRDEMCIAGIQVGKLLQDEWPRQGKADVQDKQEDGSIIVVIATDAPLIPSQLQRVAKRAVLGLARMGSIGSTESGDLILAFSTTGLKESKSAGLRSADFLDESLIDEVFAATANATEEAIVNALVAADSLTGVDGNFVPAMPVERVVEILREHDVIK